MSVVEAPTDPLPEAMRWTQTSPTRWVASSRTDVVGGVRKKEDRFVAYDEQAIQIGSFGDLTTAQLQVQHPASRAYEARLWRREQARQLRLAWVTMWVATAVLGASVVMVGVGLFA